MKPISDARTCGDGCTYLREKRQCTASEMGKTGTEIVSPILDTRKGRRDTPHMGHSSPPDLSTEPFCCKLIFHDVESIEIELWN